METLNQEDSEFIPDYLSRLEENVLTELSLREKNYSFRFNGLRRILKDVHQQKLSRALERLQDDQLIERYPDGGYGLDSSSYEMIRDHYNYSRLNSDFLEKSVFLDSSNRQRYFAHSDDLNYPVKSIINKLAGKYFSDYRFIGHYYSDGKGRLEWINAEDHSKILISSISSSKIEIMAYNVSLIAVRKFLQIIQQLFLEYQIILKFSEDSSSQAN
ncbi:MAG: hypothetical protein ACXADY_03695 [Candidatus Hodarchaeales archaeon]|jgi:hypothetical protein